METTLRTQAPRSKGTPVADGAAEAPLAPDLLRKMDAYWRAANYVSVGQIYLYDNPLLREPLKLEHVKPRLLGHWGTTPGQNFVYVHLNRVIKEYDLNMIYISGPGHGGPALVGNVYLEGTYSEIYPDVSEDVSGMQKLFKQFSFPGGIPSHVAPETPGSIHEGGELGYSLSHAFGAAFDNPDLIVACVVGDGEAETGPLATGWHSNKFLNPAHDGAVLPILHLNGYKIANPTVLARISHEELEHLLRGYGYTPYFVEGHEPEAMHRLMAATLDEVIAEIRRIQSDARERGVTERPRWPMIVLKTPKGWTGPKEVDGLPVEGTYRAHQVPLSEPTEHPEHLKILEAWMRSYRPEELFDEGGRLIPELRELAPKGERRMGANPHANGGILLRDLRLPDFRDYAIDVPQPGNIMNEDARTLGKFLRDVIKLNAESTQLPDLRPRRDRLQPPGRRVRGDEQAVARHGHPDRRPPVPRRPRHRDAQRAPVRGLARGLPPHGPARDLQHLRGVRPRHRLDVQPARQVAQGHQAIALASADRLAEHPAGIARLAAGPQRLHPPGPRVHRPRGQQEGRGDPGLPPA